MRIFIISTTSTAISTKKSANTTRAKCITTATTATIGLSATSVIKTAKPCAAAATATTRWGDVSVNRSCSATSPSTSAGTATNWCSPNAIAPAFTRSICPTALCPCCVLKAISRPQSPRLPTNLSRKWVSRCRPISSKPCTTSS